VKKGMCLLSLQVHIATVLKPHNYL